MMNMSGLVGSNWDKAYMGGKYDREEPVSFVADIVRYLKKAGLEDGLGFYPGCGNGRNLIPLLKAGLHIEAMDISRVAIKQLESRYKGVQAVVGDLLTLEATDKYDYVVSLQLFQHVNERGPAALFEKAAALVRRGGLLILRVNSTHTQLVQAHIYEEVSDKGGFTVRYGTNPVRRTGSSYTFIRQKRFMGLL